MTVHCKFRRDGPALVCESCGRRVVTKARICHAICEKQPPGLGDHVASALSAVGITKERVSKALGRPCGCKQRQQKMNDWGRKWLGIGAPG